MYSTFLKNIWDWDPNWKKYYFIPNPFLVIFWSYYYKTFDRLLKQKLHIIYNINYSNIMIVHF